MSKVKFRIRSNANKQVSINVYLSLGRKRLIETKTGFTILPKDWSDSTSRPKQNSGHNKDIFGHLSKLESFLYEKLNEAGSKGVEIDSNWLEMQIDECFERRVKSESSLVVNHMQHIIDHSQTRKVKIKGGFKIGVSSNRLKVYKLFLNILKCYENEKNKRIHFSDINRQFEESFVNWLIIDKKYSKNFAGKQVSDLKMVSNDAQKNGIEINPYALKLSPFKEANEDRHIVTLSFDELDLIKNCDLEKEYLNNARKWLLIGCEIGQRGGDLLKISPANIRVKNGNTYIDLKQEKTNKDVTIGISSNLAGIVNNEMPYPISTQKLNVYIKEVCKIAGIDEVIEGKKMNPETKRKEVGFYPKHELITNHSFRRSFSTNYYKKIPTSILIGITAHSTEELFLEYINKPKDTDSNADLFMKFHEDIHNQRGMDIADSIA